ncbi:MAG: UMP kinase [Spirochaetota bacterium]
MNEVTVLSLGGSIIVPDEVDTEFLSAFSSSVDAYLEEDDSRKLVIVTGGGATARKYQDAYKAIDSSFIPEMQDWIGIAATHINGELLRALLNKWVKDPLVKDPTADLSFTGRVLIAAGWKPGFSTDNDAVLLAERFQADRVVNLSNIAKIYSDDPKKNPQAHPLDHIGWNDFKQMVGDSWVPGRNVPFDPVAAVRASKLGLQVITAAGRDIANTMNILLYKAFVGTTIGPED